MHRFVEVLLMLALLGGLQSAGSPSLPTVIQGTVVDPRGFPYGCEHEACVVTVNNATFSKELKLDLNGRFRTEVSPGTYHVSARVPGTYPVRRAAISLREGEVANLTLSPQMRIQSMQTSVSEKGLESKTAVFLELAAEELPIRGSTTSAFIEYASKKNYRGTVTYSGAVFSFQNMTVYADTIRYTPANGKLIAVGDPVRFDNGGARVVLGQLKLAFGRTAYSLETEYQR